MLSSVPDAVENLAEIEAELMPFLGTQSLQEVRLDNGDMFQDSQQFEYVDD